MGYGGRMQQNQWQLVELVDGRFFCSKKAVDGRMGYGGRMQQNQAVDGRLGYDGKIGNGMVVELGMVWQQNWKWYGGRIGNGVVVAGNSLQQDKVVGFWHQTSYFTQHS